MPLTRIQSLDLEQGPVQRLFGVHAVHVQTGGGGAKGEIVLEAVGEDDVRELRSLLADHRPAPVAEAQGPERRLARSRLLVAALTAGQLGVILPAVAGFFQLVQQSLDEDDAVRLLPHTVMAAVAAVVALLVAAWLLSVLGSVIAFAGFTVTRDGDRLRIRRGLLARREATVPVERVRAVEVVENVLRLPFGFAALRMEVIGHAKEATAAQSLFPLLRRDEVRGFLDELLPELADDLDGLERPPARAARRYVLPPAVFGALVRRRRLGVHAGRAVGAARGAAARRLRAAAPPHRRLAAGRRPAGDPLAAAGAHDRARPGALPRVARGEPEPVPAARPAGRRVRRVRQADRRPRAPPGARDGRRALRPPQPASALLAGHHRPAVVDAGARVVPACSSSPAQTAKRVIGGAARQRPRAPRRLAVAAAAERGQRDAPPRRVDCSGLASDPRSRTRANRRPASRPSADEVGRARTSRGRPARPAPRRRCRRRGRGRWRPPPIQRTRPLRTISGQHRDQAWCRPAPTRTAPAPRSPGRPRGRTTAASAAALVRGTAPSRRARGVRSSRAQRLPAHERRLCAHVHARARPPQVAEHRLRALHVDAPEVVPVAPLGEPGASAP